MSRKPKSGKRNKTVQLYTDDTFSKYTQDALFSRYPQEEKDLANEVFNAPVGTKLVSWYGDSPDKKTISEIQTDNKGEKFLVHVSGHDSGKATNSSINVWISNPAWKNYSHTIPTAVHEHIWGDYVQIIYPKKKGVKENGKKA